MKKIRHESGRDEVVAVQPIFWSKLRSWFEQWRCRLYAYRPRFRDRHFWVAVVLVIIVATLHDVFEAKQYIHNLEVPYFVPIALFIVPVIYAALYFGFVGAIATALLAAVISIPNLIFWHSGVEKFGVVFQVFIVIAVAYFLGRRVDRERNMRQQAETTAAALKASRVKYHSLFESNPIAVLVFDPTGTILEANPAARILLGRNRATLEGTLIADLVGTANARKLLDSSRKGRWESDPLVLKLNNGPKLYLEPMLAEVSDGQSNPVIQALFRDVTEERGRKAGLKAYTASVLRAQEEERQRIARELHDDPIQELILLCRRLDSVESAGESLPALLNDRLREARKSAEEVVKRLRDFARALRPPILDDLGMVASIRRQLVDFTERTKVKCQLKVIGEDRRLPSEAELGMFRIAQEALWNVERHAEATRVTVTITFTKHEVRLDVVDNGIGFTTPSVSGDFTASGQLGLISMQERAELLGGKLDIHSSPGKGTKVTVSIPATSSVATHLSGIVNSLLN